ncbi:transposase, partial [Leptolyngbya sp. BC1307]|uniref:transposase n=1 Tax=Leptolyngbya sp. BC1307 TaxID=2029589 RepID=UPI001981C572
MNFTNLSRYSALTERSYRRQYDEAFEFMAVNSCLISRAIAPERFQVGAIDCSFVPKSGKATYGVDRFYNGKAGRAEPGLEISTIAVVNVGASMAYALSVQQTPAELEAETQTDAMTRVDHYLAHVMVTRAALPASVRHLVGDGFYSKLKWVDGILALDLEVIGKLRCDANLQYVYEGAQKAKGARRRYDGKVCCDDLSRWQSLGEVKPNVRLYTAVVWSINLKRKIRVVYLVNQCSAERACTALLFSTDIDLDPIQLYEAYRARFQIEMCQPQYPHRHLSDAAEVVYLKADFWAFSFSC